MREHTLERHHFSVVIEEKVLDTGQILYSIIESTLGKSHFNLVIVEKRFATRFNILCHQRSHTGDKLFQCSHCGKSFVHSVNLVVNQV